VNQHAEVAEFLRYLVGYGREPSGESEPDIDQEDAGYTEPSEEVVQAIPEDDLTIVALTNYGPPAEHRSTR
jgi:hypothetical protein